MRFSTLAALAALANLSQGFLIPTEISTADIDKIKTLPFEDAVAMDGRVMEISCPGCPVATDIEGKMHSVQVDSILQLNFTVLHNGADYLLLNGLQIYPIDPTSESFMQPLTAQQMVKNGDNTWEYASTPKLGYALSVRHPVTYAKDQLDLVKLHIEIVEVGDKFLTGLPTIDLELLDTASGSLMIANAVVTASNSALSIPTDDGQECTTILCKWRAIVADRISKLKGCASKARPAVVTAEPHRKPHHGHHAGPRPNEPHHPFRHHRHRHGGFARFLRGIVLHIFIPILIGIMVGISASLVGMVVGHIVVFAWRTLFRRGQSSQYHEIQQEDVAKSGPEETKGFLQHQGPPPEYVEAVFEKQAVEE